MFTVYDKETNQEVKVYDVKCNKSGYPTFLVYKDDQWRYISAKHYSDKQRINLKKVLCRHQWKYHLCEAYRTCTVCGREQMLFRGTWLDR